MMLCEYGCGQEAKHQLKNGKWCCSKSWNSCPQSRKNKSMKKTKYYKNSNNELCSFGCGQIAKYQFENGKLCCSENISQCKKIGKIIGEKKKGSIIPKELRRRISKTLKGRSLSEETKRKIGESNKGKHTGSLSEETKRKISEAVSGEKNHNHWKLKYTNNDIPLYITYAKQLSLVELPERDIKDKNILTVICALCKKRFVPSVNAVRNRVRSLKGTSSGECRIYCSKECKEECSIFNRSTYPKNHNPSNASREVQPELREMRLEIDNYTCQKCGKHQNELKDGLQCHHVEGIRWDPIESADLDKCITVCKECHKKIHKIEGCSYHDMKCGDVKK